MPRARKSIDEQPLAVAPEKKTKKSAVVKKKADGLTAEAKLLKVQHDYEAVSKKYEELCRHFAELKVECDTMLSSVKTLEMLLASFNALTRDGEVRLVKPTKGVPYWYIRAMATVKSFEVVSCTWHNWTSDHYRYVKGNMFLEHSAAIRACQALNIMLSEL